MSQFERITYIDRALREKGRLRASEVARRFEVTDRQVLRDIEYLRDRLDAPIEWDAPSRSYRYAEPYGALRFADEKLLIFHALAKGLAGNEHYVPVVTPDLLAEVESHIARDYRPLSGRVSYELPVSERLSMEDFTTACQAMVLGRRLDLSYRSAKGEKSAREVEPERLVNYSGRWYLVAWDLLRSGLRVFHMSRIERLSISKERITSPRPPEASKERIDRFLDSGFGIFKGEETVLARIRVHGPAAALVARQTWHPAQRVERGAAPDGVPWTDLYLPVADLTELLGRVLSFGASAEALEPPAFRRRWREEVGRMASLAAAGENAANTKHPSATSGGA
jgi:predicted DNA-binding transcriptional regulator YafY